MALVIAEAGENHCGSMEAAVKLIEVAARAGADYVKFQLYDAAKATLDDPEKAWFERVAVSDTQFEMLAACAARNGIRMLATPWEIAKAELIFRSGIDEVKIASFHTVDLALLDYVNRHARAVFLSSGMTSLEELARAVAALDQVPNLYLLHCVSEYPLPIERVNLRVMDTLRERYGGRAKIGYSDHTIGILAPVAAVARGAEIVEKHITLDKAAEGTDHILSADPADLAEMIRQIRAVEAMLGRPEKHLTELETQNQRFLRERFTYRPTSSQSGSPTGAPDRIYRRKGAI